MRDLDQILDKIKDISTLPHVLQKIFDVTADENAAAYDLQQLLKTDTALTAKILKVANSAYYGLSQKVVNVKNAIVFLGFKTVKNLAVAASVCDLFKSEDSCNDFSLIDLWRHSVCVAVCAKTIAQRAGLQSGEEIFTAGIMHDIGIILENQYFPDEFAAVLTDERLDETGMCACEQDILGFDHAHLGLAKK